ncbi:hypothetical protein A9G05_11965 [Pseudomonas sp. ENNP23]|nr:hypothetical protein A9G05_11965 [Pseudomonas sp. ENNP23]
MLIVGQGLLMSEQQAIRVLRRSSRLTRQEYRMLKQRRKLPQSSQWKAELVFLLQLRGPTDSVH